MELGQHIPSFAMNKLSTALADLNQNKESIDMVLTINTGDVREVTDAVAIAMKKAQPVLSSAQNFVEEAVAYVEDGVSRE